MIVFFSFNQTLKYLSKCNVVDNNYFNTNLQGLSIIFPSLKRNILPINDYLCTFIINVNFKHVYIFYHQSVNNYLNVY